MTGTPLKIVKVLSLGEPSADGAVSLLNSTFSIAAPPPLEALEAWKQVFVGPLLPKPLYPQPPPVTPCPPPPAPPPPPPAPPKPCPAPLPPPPPPPPKPPHKHHHHHCCCGCGGSDSSAASSEEDQTGSEDARIQRCVRTVAPNMLVDDTYLHVAKVSVRSL